jgi:hypothetical protein
MMGDIIVTVPKDQYKHMKDKAWAQYDGNTAYWEMGRVPLSMGIGDKVYFVMNRKVSMYATITQVDFQPQGDHCVIDLRNFRGLIAKPRYESFRGFRYFNLEEYIRGG